MKEAQRSAASWKRASYALGAPQRTSWMLNLLGSAGVMADTSQIGVSVGDAVGAIGGVSHHLR